MRKSALHRIAIVVVVAALGSAAIATGAAARGGGGGGHFGGAMGGSHFGAGMGRGFGGGHFGGGRFAGRFGHRARGLAEPFGYYDDWYSGYYDPSTVAPDEQPTYPAPVVTPPPAPNAYVVLNPYSGVPSEKPDLLRPGESLVRFPPPKKILR
jgi:hypothetical protein